MFTLLFYIIFFISSIYVELWNLLDTHYIISLKNSILSKSKLNEETNKLGTLTQDESKYCVASLMYIIFGIIGCFSSLWYLFILLFIISYINKLGFNKTVLIKVDSILCLSVILLIMYLKFSLLF